MFTVIMRLPMKITHSAIAILVLGMITSSAIAQSTSGQGAVEAVVKVSGISPAVGVTWHTGEQSELRLLGFFSTNFEPSGINNNYTLDLSYIRKNSKDEPMSTYWGLNFTALLKAPHWAPGVLFGASYRVSESFSLFGEIGLNLFMESESGDAFLSLHNSGVGIALAL